jgi:hypothetical protein
VYCIFCSADDLPALWAYRGLRQRGLVPLEIFTPEALAYNRRLEHRLRAAGAELRIELMDGRVLDGSGVLGALNRMARLPVEHFAAANPADQAYAAQEQQAIFLSWLHALPGVLINRPGPRGLCGDQRSPAEWAWLAGQAGLPALPYQHSDAFVEQAPGEVGERRFQLVVLDGEVYGAPGADVAEDLRASIRRLAELSRLRLLGIDFCLTPAGEALFASATALPDLRLGGAAFLDALARAMA